MLSGLTLVVCCALLGLTFARPPCQHYYSASRYRQYCLTCTLGPQDSCTRICACLVGTTVLNSWNPNGSLDPNVYTNLLVVSSTSCTSVAGTASLDQWCQTNCQSIIPYCPQSMCNCVNTDNGINLVPNDESQDCCSPDGRLMYYTDAGRVFRVSVDSTNTPTGTPQVCGHPTTLFVNVVDIELDASGGAFVADLNGAAVYYLPPDCSDTILVYGWDTHQVPAPRHIAIFNKRLLVGTNPTGLVSVSLRETFWSYLRHTIVSPTLGGFEDLEILPGTNIAFVSQGNKVLRLDMSTLQPTTFFDQNAPDIADIVASNECGLFFSIPDSNQVWRCSNVNDSSTCHVYCKHSNIDADTCENMWNPWGVALDCQCNLYVTSKASGKIVKYNYGNTPPTSQVLLTGLLHPQDVEFFIPRNCSGGATVPSEPSESLPEQQAVTQISFDWGMEDENEACAEGSCANVHTVLQSLIATLSATSRAIGITLTITSAVESVEGINCNAGVATLSNGAYLCSRYPDAAAVTEPNTENIALYVKQATPLATVPPMAKAWSWSYRAPGKFPNIYTDKPLLTGLIDCTQHANVEFVVAWKAPMLCWDDFVLDENICHQGTSSGSTLDAVYVDADGNVLDTSLPHQKFVCA